MFSRMVKQRAIKHNSQTKKTPLLGKEEICFFCQKRIAFMSMFMASRKQTLEREYQTYTVRLLSISTTTKPKFSYQVLGEHHKDRAEERAARSDAKVKSIFSNICSCCNPSRFHNFCQHPPPSDQHGKALKQHRLIV